MIHVQLLFIFFCKNTQWKCTREVHGTAALSSSKWIFSTGNTHCFDWILDVKLTYFNFFTFWSYIFMISVRLLGSFEGFFCKSHPRVLNTGSYPCSWPPRQCGKTPFLEKRDYEPSFDVYVLADKAEIIHNLFTLNVISWNTLNLRYLWT